jgi:hypothetical protein
MKALILTLVFLSSGFAHAFMPPGNALSIQDGDSVCGDLKLNMNIKVGDVLATGDETKTVSSVTFPEGSAVFPVLGQLLGQVGSDETRQMQFAASQGDQYTTLIWAKRGTQKIEKRMGLTLEQIDDTRSIKIITITVDNPNANGPFNITYYKLFSVRFGELLGTFDDGGSRCKDIKK